MSRWFLDYRQNWIKEFIYTYYYINRQVIMEKFDIGEAQATRDITYFRKNNVDVGLFYETSFKKYIVNDYYAVVALQQYSISCQIKQIKGE